MKNRSIAIILIIASFSIAAFAQTGSIRGTVTSEVNGLNLSGVSVTITQLELNVETDENGVYEFTNIAPGRYTLVTHIEGFSDQARTIVLAAGASGGVDFRLSLTALKEEVTVTASGSEESVFESFQSVEAIGTTRIREQANTALGEMLEREAGISKRSFGPGTSRPSIRGFEGDRVLILQDGIRNGSLGSQSGDHGEPVDALNLERLEVIKGPATLLYGSNAIGGVVNAVSGDENDAHPGLRGYFTGLGGTVNRQGGVGGGVEYGFGKFLLTAAGSTLREGDFETPLGRVPNSAAKSYGGTTSFGYFGEKGFFAGTIGFDRRRYGVPYAPLFEEGAFLTNAAGEPCDDDGEPCQYDIYAVRDQFSRSLPEIPEEQIDLKMQRNYYRVRGGFRNLNGPITGGNFYVDFSDYQHDEIETVDGADEIGTTFTNDTFTYRSVFEQRKYNVLSGRFGFEGYNRSYLTEGAEQLIDGRVRQNNFAAFALQELDFNRVALQFGGRIESNRYSPTNGALYMNRDFTGFSTAFGAKIRLWEGSSFFANFTSSYRAPSLEELYNFGPHIGTVTFEVGDQNLGRERSNGFELSLRQNAGRFRFNGSFFFYDIKDFIYLSPQDEDGNGLIDVDDGLPVSAFSQDDARYVGADLSADYQFNDYFGMFVAADIVNARLKDPDIALPRITPARFRIGGEFRYKGLSVRPEGVFAASKKADNIFPLETPTAGYGVLNINGSYTYYSARYAHIFTFGAQNLTDRLYRNHVNFIKDILPEAGRGIKASYTIRFL
ncbi:MAG: TonB-dependent receptor [Pyrinomonadaceae bacterium]